MPDNYNYNKRVNVDNRNRNVNPNNIKNLKVRQEKLKQIKRQKRKAKLKRFVAFGLAIATSVTITGEIIKQGKKVFKPEDFNYSGKIYSASQTIRKDISYDFNLLGINNWEKGTSKKAAENIDYCIQNGIPFGVVMKSNADNISDAKADAYTAMATVSKDDISCPVYYNVDSICDLKDDLFCEITETFVDELNNNGYMGAIAISEENLDKLDEKLNSTDKLIMCFDKEISYDGEYNMSHFKKSGECYSNLNFPKAKKLVRENNYSKGIDVSQHQGKINWEKVKKDGVEYAIIRFSGFSGYHSTGNLKVDEQFYENVVECQRLGIPYGIYCYTTAETEAEAKKEAKEVLRVVKALDLNPDLKIYYDIEMKKHFDNPKLSINLFKTFSGEITASGHECGIYASYSFLKDMVYLDSSLKDTDKWVARYLYDKTDRTSHPSLDDISENYTVSMHEQIGNYSMVQVSQYGKVSGISDNTVDINITIPETTYKSY